MRLRTLLVFALLLFCFNPVGAAQTADNQRTKIAIVGLVHSHCWGFVTKLNQMHQNQDLIEIVGVSDDNQELRDYVKTLVPGVPVYDNYSKLLDEKKPEVVWSFVENDRHLEITKACAARKIHVMFEKPMSATYDEARQMMALAKQAGIQLMVNYQMAWWPENYTAHDVAARGDIGKVWRVRSVIGHGGPGNFEPGSVRQKYFLKWLKDESRGGGALIDFTCYGAKWALWYLGLPKTVYAITTHTRPDIYPSNTNATVLMSYADNKVAITEGSWDLPRSFYDVEVFGDKGSVALKYPKTLELVIGTEKKPLELGTLEGARAEPIRYFVDCIRNHKTVEGVVSGDFNVNVMQIVEAARRSAASGKPVNLPLK
jgi:scyllo-inositol 2-dehydrogenase (NADP+)